MYASSAVHTTYYDISLLASGPGTAESILISGGILVSIMWLRRLIKEVSLPQECPHYIVEFPLYLSVQVPDQGGWED